MSTIVALVRFQLRRHRALFVAVLGLLVLHELAFLYVFRFWREQSELAGILLRLIPESVKEAVGVPLTDLRHPLTFKAIHLIRPDHRALQLAFGIAVASDVIAGETGRGTADLLFSHPVRRSAAVLAGAATVALHALCLFVTLLAAYALATWLLPMGPGQPSLMRLAPAAGNVALAEFAVASTALCAGSLAGTRARAVLAGVMLAVVPMLLGFMGMFSDTIRTCSSVFPERWFRPHVLLFGSGGPGFGACALALLALSAAYTSAAVVIANRRDLTHA